MYKLIKSKSLLSEVKRKCSNIVNQFKQLINSEPYFEVSINLVGSGKKNLILRNGSEPIDMDYNLHISNWSNEVNISDCKQIKQYFIKKLNQVLNKWNLPCCEDSTSSITSKKRKIESKKGMLFSFDIAITINDKNDYYRLIHHKTGIDKKDVWRWEKMRKHKFIDDKAKMIKLNNLWEKLETVYVNKKNYYLRTNQSNYHPSYICYIESVNEVYNLINDK